MHDNIARLNKGSWIAYAGCPICWMDFEQRASNLGILLCPSVMSSGQHRPASAVHWNAVPQHCLDVQGQALAGLIYLEILPLTELASMLDAQLCLRPDIAAMDGGCYMLALVTASVYLSMGRSL